MTEYKQEATAPAVARSEQDTYTFRVTGVQTTEMALRTAVHEFDETYQIDGEHPAEALEKLLHEIEWGILDSDYAFQIEFTPTA